MTDIRRLPWLLLVPTIMFVLTSCGGSDGGGAAPRTITISKLRVPPETIEAKVGDTITIDNKDTFDHTLTAVDRSFHTGPFRAGKTTFTVTKAGRFRVRLRHPPVHDPSVHRRELVRWVRMGQARLINSDAPIDVKAVRALLEESRDLHADAMDRLDMTRRCVLAGLGGGAAALLAGILAAPARADTPLDVQILQTASSLEALAVAAYGEILGLGPDRLEAPAYKAVAGLPVETARDALSAFAMETMRQHDEHRKAFHAQTTALDGNARIQDAPNPRFLPALRSADLSSPDKVVDFAAVLEKVATDSYLLNLTTLQDTKTKALMASVMAVEGQHLATLRAFGALLKGGAPVLMVIPLPAQKMKDVPYTTSSVAFPDALHQLSGPDLLADPASGAVR